MRYSPEESDVIAAHVCGLDPAMALIVVASIEDNQVEFNLISRLESGQELPILEGFVEELKAALSKPNLKIIDGHGTMETEQGEDTQG